MRWSWSSALALIVTVVAMTACVRSTSSYYVPTAGEARLNEDELRVEADRLLSVECDRLRGSKTDVSGEGIFLLDVAATGAVQRSRVSRTTGDKALDDIFGALSARLELTAQEQKAGNLRMRAGYFCDANKAITTLELF